MVWSLLLAPRMPPLAAQRLEAWEAQALGPASTSGAATCASPEVGAWRPVSVDSRGLEKPLIVSSSFILDGGKPLRAR